VPHQPDHPSYELAVAEHRWVVPERFNIAADVCDRHPREKLAMIHEHFSGTLREVDWGELQDLSNQFANVLTSLGVRRGDRVAVVLPPTPEAAAVFFATWKLGALLLSMSVLYGDEGIRHRLGDATPRVLVTDAANAGRFGKDVTPELLVIDETTLAGVSSSTTPPARRDSRRG
jgi:acetyl-CoA synthetase